jgi:hypothetical protein
MGQKESDASKTSSLFNPVSAEFAAAGRKQIEDLVKAQTELFDRLQDTNRRWLDRVQTEANLASEFATKLTAARSIPDAMIACRDWASRRFKLMAEDVEHVLDDTQKFMQTGARLLSNGSHSDAGPST